MITFEAWPKIPRLHKEISITEKIDGTNGCIVIQEHPFGTHVDGVPEEAKLVFRTGDDDPHCPGTPEFEYLVYAQSRTRIITPAADNYGFAKWVRNHAQYLADTLGRGRHFGEWWGSGIQRGYGMKEKHFSLFNTYRWENVKFDYEQLHCVPVIYKGEWKDDIVNDALDGLRTSGSQAAYGFMRPEGVVVHHRDADQAFKVLLENDSIPKSAVKREKVAA